MKTVIFMHGLGDCGRSWEREFSSIIQKTKGQVKVLLHSPRLPAFFFSA
jgi:hypothetical protein